MNKIKYLENSLGRLLHWIAAADAKIAPILAIDTAMIGFLAALSSKSIEWTPIRCISASTAAFFLVGSLAMLFFAAFPRTTGPKGSLLFFGGITGYGLSAYKSKVQELKIDQYFEDLAAQCYRNAEIANAKFKWLRLSMRALFVAAPFWIVAVYALYGGK